MNKLDDKAALALGFTHHGRFFGVVPIYMNDPESIRINPNSAMFAARGGAFVELLCDGVDLLVRLTGMAVPAKAVRPIPREA
jgi:hypothetical protein